MAILWAEPVAQRSTPARFALELMWRGALAGAVAGVATGLALAAPMIDGVWGSSVALAALAVVIAVVVGNLVGAVVGLAAGLAGALLQALPGLRNHRIPRLVLGAVGAASGAFVASFVLLSIVLTVDELAAAIVVAGIAGVTCAAYLVSTLELFTIRPRGERGLGVDFLDGEVP